MILANSFSSAVTGVLYAEDFDEIPAKTVPALTKAPTALEAQAILPSFSLEEMRAAVEQARDEGGRAERLSSANAHSAQRGAALAAVAEQLRLAHDDASVIVEREQAAVARSVLSLLSAALPALCASRAEVEVRALLARMLPSTRQLPELHIRVNPALRPVVEEELANLIEGSGTQVIWTESPKMLPGDIAVSWHNGVASRDTAAICASIRDAVMALFADAGASPDLEQGPDLEQINVQ